MRNCGGALRGLEMVQVEWEFERDTSCWYPVKDASMVLPTRIQCDVERIEVTKAGRFFVALTRRRGEQSFATLAEAKAWAEARIKGA